MQHGKTCGLRLRTGIAFNGFEQLVTTLLGIGLALGVVALPHDLLRILMADGRAAEREPAPALTAREESVIACLARGLSNAEIAAELGISTATVRSHVSHLMAKLGATNRTQAVFNAATLGIGETVWPETSGRVRFDARRGH